MTRWKKGWRKFDSTCAAEWRYESEKTPQEVHFPGVPPIFSEGQVVQASSSLFFKKRQWVWKWPSRTQGNEKQCLRIWRQKTWQGPVIWWCKESPSMPSDAVKSKLWSFTLTAALFERAIKVQERYLDIVRSWLSTSSSIHRSSIIIIIIIFFFFFFFIIVNRSSVGHHIIAICFPTLRFNRIETEFLCSLRIARIWSSAWEMAPISHSSED